MITKEELESLGFYFSEDHQDFRSDKYSNYGFSLEDNKIDYVRNSDNFHGLIVSIKTIDELKTFLTFL